MAESVEKKTGSLLSGAPASIAAVVLPSRKADRRPRAGAYRTRGISAALASALFLGLAPIFGKQAISLGLAPMAVVAGRTLMAAFLLLTFMYIFQRKYLFIYPAGLLGCVLAGSINGVGSMLYYAALGRIDAGLGQLLYALYPLFVALWMRLDNQPLNRLTILRLCLALPAVYLLTRTGQHDVDLLGMGMMLGASILYALHLPINQRVLYEMPAQTVTLYTLIAMSIVVVPVYGVYAALTHTWLTIYDIPSQAGSAVLALTLVTFLSRLTLFMGVKHLGGLQTALLGFSELLVTLVFAHLVLGERFTAQQWAGMALLVLVLLLVGIDRTPTHRSSSGGWLAWLSPATIPPGLPWQPHD